MRSKIVGLALFCLGGCELVQTPAPPGGTLAGSDVSDVTDGVIASSDTSDALDGLDGSPEDDAADTDGLIDSDTDPGPGEVSDPSLCDPSDLEGMVPDKVVNVSEEHRACTSVDDCIAIAINCSHCEGGCTGVQSTCAEAYGALLDCSDYKGPECDYECLPEGGLTVLECLDGLCTVSE